MGNEKLKRKDFFNSIIGRPSASGVLSEPLPGDPDELFDKYSRKTLGPRLYSQEMAVLPSGGPETLRVGNVTSGLAPYAGPWTIWEAAHLLRRTGFGIKKSELETIMSLGFNNAVNNLLTITPPQNPSPAPLNYYQSVVPDTSGVPLGQTWTTTNLTYASNDSTVEYYRQSGLSNWSWGLAINEATTIREKMVLFWFHFIPVNYDDVRNMQYNSATMNHDYMKLIRENSMGNFKTLIKAIAKSPAMLVFLGNQYSTASVPNENFARELLELFTMGKVPSQNYTEEDIKAASRVLSGWRQAGFSVPYPFTPGFNSTYHNQTNKVFSSFFGNTTIANQAGANGANEFDIFFDMLFTQQETTIAKYICRRLYRFFVYYDIDANVETNVITPLATLLINNNWEIAPVISTLLKSEHFYDMANRGVMIKNPMDFIAGTIRTFNINTTPPADANQLLNQNTIWQYFHNYAKNNLEFEYGLPPTVSGWKAYYQEPAFYQNWINSNTVQQRSLLLTKLINGFGYANTSIILNTIAFIEQLPPATAQDPDLLIDAILPYLLPMDLAAAYKTDLKVQTLLNGQVTNSYWTSAWTAYVGNPNTTNTNTVKSRLNSLITTLIQLAEYQLM